jgi:hypothetical protein
VSELRAITGTAAAEAFAVPSNLSKRRGSAADDRGGSERSRVVGVAGERRRLQRYAVERVAEELERRYGELTVTDRIHGPVGR